jgi:uncharacterized glyoxalase superfamily protein PhnB
MIEAYFILYVEDQIRSTQFYEAALGVRATLQVPGITEFALTESTTLAVMPESGIKKLLGDALPDPAQSRATPRAEVYLVVDDPAAYHVRALAAGALELRPLSRVDWGHEAAYSLDPDFHVLAFARVADEN